MKTRLSVSGLFAGLMGLFFLGGQALAADAPLSPEAAAAQQAAAKQSIDAIKQTAPVGSYTAIGRQIYTCGADHKWPAKGRPVAALFDGTTGELIGIHYARRDCDCNSNPPDLSRKSPAWELFDGSQVAAKSSVALKNPGKSTVDGKESGNVPSLNVSLDDVQLSTEARERLASATNVVREAQGGAAPTEPCNAGEIKSVPYKATYSFYNSTGNAPSSPGGPGTSPAQPTGGSSAAGASVGGH